MHQRRPFVYITLTVCVLISGIAFLLGSVGGGGGDGAGAVSGAIFIGEGQVLDSDTKDPNNPWIDNNTNPQTILIPATVGGNADHIQDRYDVYRIRIDGPVTIVLAIADPDPFWGDLDLRLTKTDGTVIEESTGTDALELIETGTIPSGDYYVVVDAYSGSSNYVLSLGITAGASAISALMTSSDALIGNADWISDEIIVKFRSASSVFQSQSEISTLSNHFGITQISAPQSALALMKVRQSDPSPFLLQQQSGSKGAILTYDTEEARKRAHTLRIIKALNDHPAVEYAEPNYISRISLEPDDRFYGFQWHYPAINLPQAWNITTGDDSVVVGIIDTGVLINHPDLSGRILRDGTNTVIGYDFISNSNRANDGDGIDPNPNDSGDLAFGDRSSFHGTHVAGTVAAATNNLIGVAGITWQGKIMPLRALGIDGGTDFDIAQCILYAAREDTAWNTDPPPVKADIINLSLGPSNPSCSPLPPISNTLRDAVEKALAAGVIVVVAAGNDSCNVPTPLSTVDGVITVSATDIARQRAPYSNFGATIDVAAPGGNTSVDLDADGIRDGVISTLADDGSSTLVYEYGIYQGTSMAAPHAAGVFALMRAVNPALTPANINQLLDGTLADPNKGPITIDIGTPGPDNLFGFGLIDAFAAVNIANSIEGGGAGTPPLDVPVLSVLPERLNFSFSTGVLQIALNNAGTAEMEITAISSDDPWLTIDAPDTPFTIPAGSQTATLLTVSVDRSGLAGTYLGSIEIATSNAGNRTVSVSMQVQANVGGDVGVVYVLVVDPETLETVAQTQTGATDGYTYRTPRVPAGTYLIAAGTDKDNDRSVCDAGEACGLFPLVDNPGEVDVSGNITDIDFAVIYELFATNTALQDLATGDQPFEGFQLMDVKGLNR
jgi:serine protease